MKYFSVVLIILLIFSSLSFPLASAAYLYAYVNPENQYSKFKIQYQRTVMINYPEGSKLADDLSSKRWNVEVFSDSSNSDVQDLMQRLNQKIRDDGSISSITDLNVEYDAKLQGRGLATAIDYNIVLTGNISNNVLREYNSDAPALIDMGWRGITVKSPIVVDGVEINIPFSILKSKEPNLHSMLIGTEAETILSQHLIDAEGLKNEPLKNWRFVFSPTEIGIDNSDFGLSKEISDFAISVYVTGESPLQEGEKRSESYITIDDKEYRIRSIESSDYAKITVIGFASVDELDNTEIFKVLPEQTEDFRNVSVESPQPLIVFGIIVTFFSPIILGIIAFFASRRIIRKIKHQKNIGKKNFIICIITSIGVFLLVGSLFPFFQYLYSLFESF